VVDDRRTVFAHNAAMPRTTTKETPEAAAAETLSERQQAILDAALACFLERGVATTTIDDIRQRSGASIGSIYHHFGSKDAIAARLYVSALQEHKQLLRGRLARARSAEQAVKAVVRAYVDWVSGHPERARFVLYNRSAIATGVAAAELQEHNRTELATLVEQLTQYVSRGEVRKLPKECYVSMLTGAAQDYARLWLSGRVRKPLAELREDFAEAAWRALKPD
jgi:AcrR family transcriptional regulator